jgi:hypothetical protein
MVSAFFNALSGRLVIELSEAPVPITPNLSNVRAPQNAHIVSLRLDANVFEDDEFRPLTAQELDAIALDAPEVRLRGLDEEESTSHAAPDRMGFRVRDLLAAVEAHERQTRGASKWFDGVDVHHVFFEGLELLEDGSWQVNWGS